MPQIKTGKRKRIDIVIKKKDKEKKRKSWLGLKQWKDGTPAAFCLFIKEENFID